MSDNRPIVYKEGDLLVFRASSIGMPGRCLTAAALGYDPLPAPEYLEKAAEAGNRYEKIVKSKLTEQGWTITGEQGAVDVPITDRLVVRGHLDGWHAFPPDGDSEFGFEWRTLAAPGADLMLEIKSMSGRVYSKWLTQGFDGFPAYAWQLSVYMRATGRPALYVVINRDTDEFDFRVVDEPPVPWQKIRQKAMVVQYNMERNQLPDCEGHTYVCPYDYLCTARQLQFEEVEDGSLDMIASLAAEYDQQRQLLDEVKALQEVTKEELKLALGKRDVVEAKGWVVRRAEVNSKRTDKQALNEYLTGQGRKLDEFMKETKYERMTVRREEIDNG